MNREDKTPAADIEFRVVGTTGPPGSSGSSRPGRDQPRPRRWRSLLAALVAGAVIIGVMYTNNKRAASPAARPSPAHPSTSAHPSTAATSPPSPVSTPAAPTEALPAVPVKITMVGHPLLGVTAGWELFGRGLEEVVRIQPALGRVTRTRIPTLASSGSVSLLAAVDRLIIRPFDNVPGYVVPDGQPVHEMSAKLASGGPVLPGPDLQHLWVPSGDDRHPVMVLAALDGTTTAETIAIPPNNSPLDAAADGVGYLFLPGLGGVYDARPQGFQRITTGSLVAVGPTRWLAVECDSHYRCATVVIDRADGSRHVLGTDVNGSPQRGVISPDGANAAIFKAGPNGASTLSLLDLASGREKPVDMVLSQDVQDGTVLFSPDSRWLFAIGANGQVAVIDTHTAHVGSLGVTLPPLSQLAFRAAPPN